MEETIYQIDNKNIKFETLNVLEGVKISNILLSCVNGSELNGDVQSNIDLGRFSKEALPLICKKMLVEVTEGENKVYKSVGTIENIALFFSNPLITTKIIETFITYLTPFLSELNPQK